MKSVNEKLETLDDALRCNGLSLKRLAEEMDNTTVEVVEDYGIYDVTRQFWWSDEKKSDLIKFIEAR